MFPKQRSVKCTGLVVSVYNHFIIPLIGRLSETVDMVLSNFGHLKKQAYLHTAVNIPRRGENHNDLEALHTSSHLQGHPDSTLFSIAGTVHDPFQLEIRKHLYTSKTLRRILVILVIFIVKYEGRSQIRYLTQRQE